MNNRVIELYKIIKDAKEELEILRKTCAHEDISECNYSIPRPGNIIIAEVCNDCGEFIKDTGKPFQFPKENKFIKSDTP